VPGIVGTSNSPSLKVQPTKVPIFKIHPGFRFLKFTPGCDRWHEIVISNVSGFAPALFACDSNFEYIDRLSLGLSGMHYRKKKEVKQEKQRRHTTKFTNSQVSHKRREQHAKPSSTTTVGCSSSTQPSTKTKSCEILGMDRAPVRLQTLTSRLDPSSSGRMGKVRGPSRGNIW